MRQQVEHFLIATKAAEAVDQGLCAVDARTQTVDEAADVVWGMLHAAERFSDEPQTVLVFVSSEEYNSEIESAPVPDMPIDEYFQDLCITLTQSHNIKVFEVKAG